MFSTNYPIDKASIHLCNYMLENYNQKKNNIILEIGCLNGELTKNIIEQNKEMSKNTPIGNIFLKFLGRPPTDEESKKSVDFITQDENIQGNLAKFIQVVICTGEFRNVK